MCVFLNFLSRFRGPSADDRLPPDASPAADSDEETAAPGSHPGRRSSAESRAASARTGRCSAEGKDTTTTNQGILSHQRCQGLVYFIVKVRLFRSVMCVRQIFI